jgi:hypothetical protein
MKLANNQLSRLAFGAQRFVFFGCSSTLPVRISRRESFWLFQLQFVSYMFC